jgi:hypothetical protein
VTRGARRRGPTQHRGRSTLPAKRLASAPHFGRTECRTRTQRRARERDRSAGGRPAQYGRRTYGLRFLLTRFSAIDVFSPSSGITIHAAR